MSWRIRALDIARRFPATLGIMGVTLGFFAAEHALGGGSDLAAHLRLGALRTDRIAEHGEYYRLFMPMFLHFGWVHLVLNGMALLQLGALVESLWGGRRLIAYYVLCGVAAALTSAVLNPPMPASVGASGAILGLAGLVLGTIWFGNEPARGWLLDVVGQRLFYGVLLTFCLGLGLWLVLPIVDNWAHAGGLAMGVLLAAATPDPTQEDDRRSLAGSAAAVAAILAATVWMAVDGAKCLATMDLDTARILAIRMSERPGTIGNIGTSLRMLDHFDAAGAMDEGNDAFANVVVNFDEPVYVSTMLSSLFLQVHEANDTAPVNRDAAMEVVGLRWLELAPDDPEALNGMAWHLVTRGDADPDQAETLSRRSLERMVASDAADNKAARAAYLDTLGEALYQLERYNEALDVQTESVTLFREARDARGLMARTLERMLQDPGAGQLEELEERLEKIENARSG